jgi:hypothetical protein
MVSSMMKQLGLWLCIPLLVALLSLPYNHWETDFLSFYAGAKLAGTGQLYSLGTLHDLQAVYERDPGQIRPFTRPAYYAVLLQPFSHFTFRTASVLWEILNVLAIGVFIWLWCRNTAHLVVLFPPLWFCLMAGQDAPLFLAAFAASVWLLRGNRPLLAGLVLAFCLVKFHLFLLLPLLIVAKRLWRLAAGITLGGAFLLAVSFVVNGNWVPSFLTALRINEKYQEGASQMFNLTGLTWQLPFHWIWFAVGASGVAIALWCCIRLMDINEASALTVVASVLVSAHAFGYDLTFLLPWITLHGYNRAMKFAIATSVAILSVSQHQYYLGQVIVFGIMIEDVFRHRDSGVLTTPIPAPPHFLGL